MGDEGQQHLVCAVPGLGRGWAPGRARSALGGFFPEAGARAAALAVKPSRITLLVAPCQVFLPRVWRLLAARRPLPAFRDLVPGLLAEPRGWADLAADLRAALGPLPITVRVVDAMTPPLPDTALAMFQRLFAAGVQLPTRQAERLAAVHRRLPQPEPIAAFSDTEAAWLGRRFQHELDLLAALPGVEVTAATPLGAAA